MSKNRAPAAASRAAVRRERARLKLIAESYVTAAIRQALYDAVKDLLPVFGETPERDDGMPWTLARRHRKTSDAGKRRRRRRS